MVYPNDQIDSRAYARTFRPLAEAGYVVVVLNEPLGLASADPDLALEAFATYPDVTRWVVAGHGAGGDAAAQVAATHSGPDHPVVGLLLHASAPTADASDAAVLAASVWGDLDGVVGPADIAASRTNLPTDTDFVRVSDAVHSSFADYGDHPGDGETPEDHEDLQEAIVAASLTFMERVAAAAELEGAADARGSDDEAGSGSETDGETEASG
ncbi:hypothetical protein GCM10025865_15310 [Paraoerskovia sediminicola]|uniref:Alpha/beta hydrolase fold-5 domain-containing protein n=1 Tax=Paraoerskovia sediminicola TaxID=1138587 RepID=A0ABN6XB84_9CELL|nr:alpha/beta hydrolase [Paraoerskovia sediminicola]BDZ42232.1 hypothetical protein GCM10025865_15310 [Paraoerskovia sediminicola]